MNLNELDSWSPTRTPAGCNTSSGGIVTEFYFEDGGTALCAPIGMTKLEVITASEALPLLPSSSILRASSSTNPMVSLLTLPLHLYINITYTPSVMCATKASTAKALLVDLFVKIASRGLIAGPLLTSDTISRSIEESVQSLSQAKAGTASLSASGRPRPLKRKKGTIRREITAVKKPFALSEDISSD